MVLYIHALLHLWLVRLWLLCGVKKKAKLDRAGSNNISERLTGRKPVRNEVTSERGYCRIISVARAIARGTGIIRNILYY